MMWKTHFVMFHVAADTRPDFYFTKANMEDTKPILLFAPRNHTFGQLMHLFHAQGCMLGKGGREQVGVGPRN